MNPATATGSIGLLTQLSRVVYRRATEEVIGMRLKQLIALDHLREETCLQSGLGALLMLDPNNCVLLLNDLDESGWIERFSAPDPSLAPDGEELVQAQMPIRPGESADRAALRLERLFDAALPNRSERQTWHRRQVMEGRTGPLDYPGKTWRDRPGVDRGDGVYLAGDMVAAPGLLSEVAWASGVEAGALAAASLVAGQPALGRVA